MESTDKKIWFPAKRYGWGWALPVAWQGWVVLLFFVLGLVAASRVFPPAQAPFALAACIVALVAALTAVCWLKGEKPKWRWGKDE
ncbi:hypothetical protein [Burkholderia cepacia]|uniref:hypothetical protein n=1 Tax=Burkholderia TaxID=32008 RepID=UPI00075E0DB5|nr:hypothetical protein [Burkholderia cepacia]KVW92277.1 hypothetical protein WL00_02595 [Burkholderia cepacia]KVX71559.1 hypothetical protein WL07_15470 [Burkholderia cepacia]MBY4800161.1 hypothetical protein [Burkholderia cepacia]MCA8329215.1 hypothetical protein [Burkholderia cepacia]